MSKLIAPLLLVFACTPPPPTGPTTPTPRPAPPPTPIAADPPEASNPAAAISKDDRVPELYQCWFESPYQYMFKGNDRDKGEFMAGTHGIVYYGNLADCMGRIADGGNHRVVGDITPIEKYIGMAVLAKKGGSFKHFDDKVIRWGHENLIPDPALDVGGETAQARYDRQFKRFFHTFTESYLLLKKDGAYEKEQEAYLAAVNGGQDGLEYLAAQYTGWLASYDVTPDMTSMTVPMAVGFWLRRGMDGTDGELWIGLKKVLRLYDASYYADVQKRYADVRVDW